VQFKVLLPSKVLFDEPVQKVVVQGKSGSYGILPRRRDLVLSLSPGVLSYVDAEGRERFLGVDEGVLVKCGNTILLSTLGAVRGRSLDSLRRAVESQFVQLSEREQAARRAIGRLEAGVVRQLLEFREPGG